jgi:hypothetical protein
MKNPFLKVLSKKSLLKITAAVVISGLIPVGAVLAQGEIVAELVAEQGVTLSGSPGDTIWVPVNIYVTPRGTNVTNAVTVYAKFEGKSAKTVSFTANQFNVKKQVLLEYTIPMTTAPTVSPRVIMTSTDMAGNDQVSDSTADTITIHVIQDTTAPTITLTNPISGFYNASNLPSTFEYSLDEDGEVFVNGESHGNDTAGSHTVSLPSPTEGTNTVTLTAKDAAGNVSEAASFTYFYDTVNPNVTATPDRAPNEEGWYNKDVTVSFSATDEGSGVNEGTITADVTVTDDGEHVVTGSASDNAGNSGSASVTVKLDKTNPVITAEDGGIYTLNQQVGWSASDSLSGLASDATGTVDTRAVGSKTQTITATDKAGNIVTKTITYCVVYNFGGILQPLVEGATYKAGSTIPMKFQLKDDAGAFISDAIATITYSKVSNNVAGSEVVAVSTGAASTGNQFRYDSTANQYIFNLSTKGIAAGTYQVSITLNDGTTKTVRFSLK